MIKSYAPHPSLRLLLAVVFMVCALTSFAEPEDEVSQAVRSTVMSVLETLQDQTMNEKEKKTLVASIVAERFDFESMTSRVLATNWKRANAAQKRRVTALFQGMLTETYWKKFATFSGEEVEFLSMQNRSSDHASFHTVIKSKTARIPVDYKLFRTGDTWKAYDVVIEQVSLVRNYRGKFQSIVRKGGIDGLIKHLEKTSS